MTKITKAKVQLENGQTIKADAHGNNIAIICPSCHQTPILLVALKSQKGSNPNNLSTCSNCRKSYFIISDLEKKELSEVVIKEI